jgi:electron transport protein HydN
VGAITFNGRSVAIDAERCFGCKACLAVCPVGAMQVGTIDVERHVPVAHKCDLCTGFRDEPACVSVCPAGALSLFSGESLQKLSSSKRKESARRATK